MTDLIKFMHELGIDLRPEQIAPIEAWLNADRAENWDGGASRAGRYGHEDHWYNGGPFRDNPYRSPEYILEMYGEDEDW